MRIWQLLLRGALTLHHENPNTRGTKLTVTHYPSMYGPENPRKWATSHPSLRHNLVKHPNGKIDVELASGLKSPHETGGVARAQRTGLKGRELVDTLLMPRSALTEQYEKDLSNENTAKSLFRPIHDVRFPKGWQ